MSASDYSKILDIALECSKSSILGERKKGEKILRQSACLEIGTKHTRLVREWFITHTDELIAMISTEQDSQLLWGYIYMLQSFCQRYIRQASSVQNSEDFIKDPRTVYFEEQAYACVLAMVNTEDRRVLQAIGSFLWGYYDARAWDIFIEVLKKKRDKLTLSQITLAVANCYGVITKNKAMLDFWGKPLHHSQLISKEQMMNLRDSFQRLEAKSLSSTNNNLSTVIRQLDELLENQ